MNTKSKVILCGTTMVMIGTVAFRLGTSGGHTTPVGAIHTNYHVETPPVYTSNALAQERITMTGEWQAAFPGKPDLSSSHETQRIPRKVFRTNEESANQDIEKVIKQINKKWSN